MSIMWIIGMLVASFIYNDSKKRGHGTIISLLLLLGSIFIPYITVPLYLIFGRIAIQKKQDDRDDVIDIEATVVEDIVDNQNDDELTRHEPK